MSTMTTFDDINASLACLSKAVKAAASARLKHDKEAVKLIEAAAKEAELMDWKKAGEVLRNEAVQLQRDTEQALRQRRETLKEHAEQAGVPFRGYEAWDRIGIFDVRYSGLAVTVELGGVKVESFDEADGGRLFKRLQEVRSLLDAPLLDRKQFFQNIKAAYTTVRRRNSAEGDYVLVHAIHVELLLERARHDVKFVRNPDPKNIAAYPLHQFVYDLARFLNNPDGPRCGSERIQTQAPSMRESKATVQIPNLKNPAISETSVARLAVMSVS
jgi:hypothetical protein